MASRNYADSPMYAGGAIPIPKTHYRKQAVIKDDREDDYTSPYRIGGEERVLASGVVEAGVFALGAAASAYFVATRKSDIYWAVGLSLASFFVAGGARNNAAVRDVSLGVLSGSVAVVTLRAANKLKLASGQQ